MRLDEITTDIGDDLELTSRQYKSIINDLKNKGIADSTVRNALSTIKAMWAQGDKLVGSYKSIIADFDLDV